MTSEAAEQLAEAFHTAYEELAPSFGYETRSATARPWAEVPDPNRSLMVAVAQRVLETRLVDLGMVYAYELGRSDGEGDCGEIIPAYREWVGPCGLRTDHRGMHEDPDGVRWTHRDGDLVVDASRAHRRVLGVQPSTVRPAGAPRPPGPPRPADQAGRSEP